MPSTLSTNLLILIDSSISLLSVDDNIESLLGYSSRDFLSQKISFVELIHRDDKDISTHMLSSALSIAPIDFNIRLRHADGKIRCIKGQYTKTKDTTQAINLALVLQDPKTLYHTNVKQSSLSSFHAMMGNSQDYIYFKDRNHVFTGASQTLVALTSPSQHSSDLLGQTDYDVFPEEYADRYYALEKQVFSGASVANEIQATLDNSGIKGWVDNRKYPTHNETNEISGLFGIARDITDNHNKQQQIERLLQEKNSLLNNQLIAFAIVHDRKITWTNQSLEKLTGYSKSELLGQSTRLFYAHEHDFLTIGKCYQQLEKNEMIAQDIEFIHSNGQALWVDLRGTLLDPESGDSLWTIADISSRKKSEQALMQSEMKFKSLFNSSSDAVALFEGDTFIDANPATLTLFGCTSLAEFCGKTPADLSPLYQADKQLSTTRAKSMIQLALNQGQHQFEWIHKRVDTNEAFVADILISTMLINGKTLFQSTIRNITAQKLATQQLQLSARVFSSTHDGIVITDAEHNIIDVNPAFSTISGYSAQEVIGKNPKFFSSGKHGAEFYAAMWHSLNTEEYWQGEVWNRKKDGEIYTELLSISCLKDEQGKIVNYIGISSDITHSKQQQEKLNLIAHYDVLTGLPNRALFADRFIQAISHSKRNQKLLAICFLDLDNFKPVNDTFGHETGDQLLIEVAKRISHCIKNEDTISRQGGDEFAILLNDIESYEQCEQTLARIHHSLSQAFFINDKSISIGASTGITLYPVDSEDIDTLLRHADQAMYQAKQLGRNRYLLFNSSQDKELINKHHQLHEIENAFINDEFVLYYQPKVNMLTGKVYGAEALIRWLHPKKGLIPPADFLPLIDGSDLEIKVGDWVINQALEQMEYWCGQNIQLEISVNISSLHLQSKNFIQDLDSALSRHPYINSQYLQLEILESSALGDLNTISQLIKTCQNTLGINIALDDFGTGYSSLTHIRRLSANVIKIDQSFVRDMLDDPNDYAIIHGIIGLASAFNNKIIAEGVETTEHGLMLLLLGCHYAQGYGIAKPMQADLIPAWLTNYQANTEWLNFGNKQHSIKENKKKLFRLIAEQWKNKFIKNILADPKDTKDWPIIAHELCHCGYWIKRELQDQLFELESVLALEAAHKVHHQTALKIYELYHNNELEAARTALVKLQLDSDAMSNRLGLCE